METSTDSLKALAVRTGLTIAAIREIARDLGIWLKYSSERRTWVLDTDPETITKFNQHLANIAKEA